jgi:hypothetical protein
MSTAKEQITELVKKQPDDSSYDEIIRVLAFDLMVQRGLKDSDEDRTIYKRRNASADKDLAELNWTQEAETWLKDIYDNMRQTIPPPPEPSTAFTKRHSYLDSIPKLDTSTRLNHLAASEFFSL